MEYKINQYNITDIKYKDLKGLISCFESSIPLSKISLCNFGPNIMHVKSTENKFPKTKEDKKILKSQASLILSSLNSKEKNEESNFCFSMSNNINKIYLKRILYQISSLLQIKNRNKDNRIDGNSNNSLKQDIKEILNFFNLISYFTCIKDEYGDEIPITDYSLSISVDKNIKFNKLNLIQFNYEYITQSIINDFQNNNATNNEIFNNKNNIHIFYMLIYNLSFNELSDFLYCEETKDYFSIFSEEETLDDITKRFIFINQFKLLKNNSSFKLMTKNNEEENENRNESIRYNVNIIKNEYSFYNSLFEEYLKIKKNFLITDEDEKKIFGLYFAILLLSEFDFMQDNLISGIVNRNYRELRNLSDQSFINLFSQLRNILISDIRFNFLVNKNQIERTKFPYLLSKLSYCLGVPEDKIIYLLLTESNDNRDNSKDKNDFSNKDNIISNELSVFKNIFNLINILYLKSIDKILELFSLYIKKKKLSFSNNTYKPRKILNVLLMRSNLVYNITFEKYLFSNNSFLAVGDNYIDSNSFIINQNIKEHLYANYIQEKKNYIYLKNSLSLNFDKNFPKIIENSEYLNSIFRESINFEEILNVYENEICGLLKLLNINENSNNSHNYNIFDSKKNFNINHFKVQFNKNISRKNKIEIIEVYNSINQLNETFIKVTHTFGVFLYDLNQLFFMDYSNNSINSSSNTNRNNRNGFNIIYNANKEQTINKILEYKPNDYNLSSVKYYREKTNKIINSLNSMKKPLYITCLVELNKFNTLTLFDDMKINIIYVYYSNYYNYILNINDIRQYFTQKSNINIIPKNMRNKDNFTIFKFLSKKIHITSNDYITDKFYKSKENNLLSNKYRINKDTGNNLIDFIFVKNKLSNLFENDRNISLMIYKYNYRQYIQFFCEKVSSSKFNYFIYAINGVKAFVKLTKIYKEKLILSNVRNLMTDIIVDNYDILKENEIKNKKINEPILNSLSPINHKLLPKIDNLDELVFDFNKDALGKMLPKLRSNLVQLKRIWRDYIYDIIYLTNNVSIFYNKENTELVIEQRILNFQILLFLFHKNYKFINSDSIKKYGILVTEFTKTISNEVLRLISELRKDFDMFLSENNMINKNLADFKKTFENITFEKLILKRIELQNIINQKIKEKEGTFAKINQQKMREKNLENKDWNLNGGEDTAIIEKNKIFGKENKNNKNINHNNENKFKEFSISQKDLNEGRLDNSLRMSKTRKPVSRVIESFNTVNRNSQLQLTYRNTSENNTPKTQDNNNYSDIEDTNIKIEPERIKKNNNYEYKYDNVSFRNIDESTNRNIKAKIIYSNNQSNNNKDKNLSENSRFNRNNINDNRRDFINNKKNLNNNQNDNLKFSTPLKTNIDLDLNNNRNNNDAFNKNQNNNNRYNQRQNSNDNLNNNNQQYKNKNDNQIGISKEINGVNNKNLNEGIYQSKNNDNINQYNNTNENKNNLNKKNNKNNIGNEKKENIINIISNNNSNNNKNNDNIDKNYKNKNNIPNQNEIILKNKNDNNNLNKYEPGNNLNDNKKSKYKNNIIVINECKNNKIPNTIIDNNNNSKKYNDMNNDNKIPKETNFNENNDMNNDNKMPKDTNLNENNDENEFFNKNGNTQNNNINNDNINIKDESYIKKLNNKLVNDINPIKNNIDAINNREPKDEIDNKNLNDSPSFSKGNQQNSKLKNGIVLEKNNHSSKENGNKNDNKQEELNNKDISNKHNNIGNNDYIDKEISNGNIINNNSVKKNYNDNYDLPQKQDKNIDDINNKCEDNNNDKKSNNSNNNLNNISNNNEKSKNNHRNSKINHNKNHKADVKLKNSNNNSHKINDKNNNINNNYDENLREGNQSNNNSQNNMTNRDREEEMDYISFKENKNQIGNEKIKIKPTQMVENARIFQNNNEEDYNPDEELNNDKEHYNDKGNNGEDYNDNEKEDEDYNDIENDEENYNNNDNEDINDNNNDNENGGDNDDNFNKNNINEDEFNFSWFPTEEIEKINQTLSDINEVNLEKNNQKNYLTYSLDEKNYKLIKEVPDIIKKRINIYIIKLMKEREIKKMSSEENINIPSLKELEKRIKQIRKEINYIDINDSIFEKLEELHFKGEEIFDENNIIDFKLYNMAEEFNKEFYDDIEAKLQMAEEAITNLNQ